jgi:hypothetical protein
MICDQHRHLLLMKPFLSVVIFTLFAASTLIAAPVEIIPAELRGGSQPQVAVAPNGRVHVVFGKGTTIYHTASADGRSFSAPVKIGDLDKLALGMRRGPRVSATDRMIVVTAISHSDGNVHTWTSADGGTTWNQRANLNDADKSAREGMHAMAGDGKGFVFSTWLDLRNGGTELWGATSQDGGARWGANALIYKSPDGHICECCHPSAAIGPHGEIAVMWRNWLGSRDMYAAMSNDGGKTFTPAQKLGIGTWKLNGCPMDGGANAISPAGKALSAWRREKTAFVAEGPGAEQQLADLAFQPIVVAGKNGSYYLWESGGGLMLKKGAASPSRFADKASFAAGAATPKGGAVVVWQSEFNGTKTLLAETLD